VEEVSAFVLAGGRSSRMGADKALLTLGGESLLAIALRNAQAVCPQPAIVGAAARYAAFGRVVDDRITGCGPLGGIHAALYATTSELNVILSVDLPLMVPDFLRWLVGQADRGEELITVPRIHGRCEPLCAVYRRATLPVVEQALREGDFKVDRIFGRVSTRYAGEAEVRAAGFADGIFRNVNTPEDYVRVKGLVQPSRAAQGRG